MNMTLSSRSMYVSISQRIWQAQASDRGLAHGVEKTAEAKNRTMKVVKQLAPTDYLLPIRRIAIYGREQHERLTLPGMMKGQQLLATKLFDEYAMTQAEIRDSFFKEVDGFCQVYPAIVEEAPKRLGKAYNASDYPHVESIRAFFDYAVKFSPVPESGNWLLDDVDTEDLSKLRNEIENEKNNMFRDATKELVERTASILEKLATHAKEYTEGKSNGGVLSETTINAVKDMAGLVSKMNLTADPLLDATANEMIQKFGNLDAKEMRHSAELRNNVSAAAQRLLDKLKGAK